MSRAVYYVVKNGAGWRVTIGDKNYDYTTQADAMTAARNAAKKTHENGRNSQVVIQGADGKWQTEWTYGDDPEKSKG